MTWSHCSELRAGLVSFTTRKLLTTRMGRPGVAIRLLERLPRLRRARTFGIILSPVGWAVGPCRPFAMSKRGRFL